MSLGTARPVKDGDGGRFSGTLLGGARPTKEQGSSHAESALIFLLESSIRNDAKMGVNGFISQVRVSSSPIDRPKASIEQLLGVFLQPSQEFIQLPNVLDVWLVTMSLQSAKVNIDTGTGVCKIGNGSEQGSVVFVETGTSRKSSRLPGVSSG